MGGIQADGPREAIIERIQLVSKGYILNVFSNLETIVTENSY